MSIGKSVEKMGSTLVVWWWFFLVRCVLCVLDLIKEVKLVAVLYALLELALPPQGGLLELLLHSLYPKVVRFLGNRIAILQEVPTSPTLVYKMQEMPSQRVTV